MQLNEQPLLVLNQTRMLLRGRAPDQANPAAKELHQHLTTSRYSVFVLGAPDIPADDFSTELMIRAASDLVRDINATERAALLNLATGLGDTTAQLSGAWHNGFGIRTCFARGYPEQDLQRYAGDRLLGEGEADLLVWLSSLSTEPPPSCGQAQIVIGHPAMQFDGQPPAVYLPVAVPGVHRDGFQHRADGLRMLPLRRLVDNTLHSTDDLCQQLLRPQAEEF
jgi:formylmethanofuran dehydrogenase subunit B